MARLVAGGADPDARIEAAVALRRLLDGAQARRSIGDAILRGELDHADACPRVLAACATRDEFSFHRLLDGLARFRGADLVHVGISRTVCDHALVHRLRVWARSTAYPIPRLVVFDGAWMEPVTRSQGARRFVLDQLTQWIESDSDPISHQHAMVLIWRDLLEKPERFDYWGEVLWERWPRSTKSDRDLMFDCIRAVRRGHSWNWEPRSTMERVIHTLYSLSAVAHSVFRPSSLAQIDDLCDLPYPTMVQAQRARAIGSCVGTGALSEREVATALAHYLPGSRVTVGTPSNQAGLMGFMSGFRHALELLDEALAIARAAPFIDRLRAMHQAFDDETDPFGALRGTIVGSLVACGRPELLLEQLIAEDAHPYELNMGCRAAARWIARNPERGIDLGDRVLASVRDRPSPWAFTLLGAMCDALPPEGRWREVQRRLAVAKEAAPDQLLSPAVVEAILSSADDRFVREAATRNGDVPPYRLWAVKESMRLSMERGEAARRREHHAEDRVAILRAWFEEAAGTPSRVVALELVTFLSVLRRVHVTEFLASAGEAHVLALDAIRRLPVLWQHLFKPYPAGWYVGSAFLALVAEVALLAPGELSIETHEVCRAAIPEAWTRLLGLDRRAFIPATSLARLRRVFVTMALLGVDAPRSDWIAGSHRLDAELVGGLVALEPRLRDSERKALLHAELVRLEDLHAPRDARTAEVVKLMLHNLKRRAELAVDDPLADAPALLKRLRALVGGPDDASERLADVLRHALELAGAYRDPDRIALTLDHDRPCPEPYVVMLLVLEEMIANAIEHGGPSSPIVVEAPGPSSLVAVISESIDPRATVERMETLQVGGTSGLRFATRVAVLWGMRLHATVRDDRVCVTLERRGNG